MKRLFPVIALIAVLLVLCLPAHAEIALPDSMTVIEAEAFFGDISLSGHLAIPEGVTHIGDRAFSGCTGLNSVSFPSSLTSIGNGAFSGCTALEGTLIVRGALTVAEDAFDGCTGYSVHQEDSSKNFSYSIENGEARITRYNASTTDPVVVVPALLGGCPVTTIGSTAFRDCPATQIHLPSSVRTLEAYAFYTATSLTEITGIDHLTSVGNYAFYGCRSLKSVTIGGTLNSLSFMCFASCTALESVTCTGSVATITEYAFMDASALKTIDLSDATVAIGYYAFQGCTSLTSINGTENLVSIGAYAFQGCTSLTSINGTENLVSIGAYAFQGCTSLTSINVTENLVSIGAYAFQGCTSLTSFRITDKLQSVSTSPFAGSGITSLTLHTDKTLNSSITSNLPYLSIYTYKLRSDGTYELASFRGTQAEPLSAFNGVAVTAIGYECFQGTALSSCTIPDSIRYIDDYAFAYSDLTSITLPDSVTSIGSNVFERCYLLEEVTLPDTLRSMGDYTFYNCSSLNSVNLPLALESMGTGIFSYCSALEEVTLPTDLSILPSRVFSDCSSLKLTLHTDSQIGDGKLLLYDIFRDSPLVTIYNYKLRSDGTYELVHFLGARAEIPASFNGVAVTGIGEDCFYLSGLTSCTIPSSIRHIGKGAFAFTDLTSIALPETLDSMGLHVFWLCESLTDVTLPTNLTSLPDGTFYGCSALESIVLPDSITELGQFCFENTGLTQINLDNIAFAPVCCFRGSRLRDYAAERIIAEVIKDGMTDFEKTLAVHDWLIYNAEYSYAFIGSEGVMYAGRGVCQSYTDAMLLILGKLEIECLPVVSQEMDHTWNLVKLDGEWYHVDATWDDPIPNGNEYHLYFGLNDERMAADHTWIASDYPAATGTRYYLGVDNGE